MSVYISSDSTCDLTAELVKAYGIGITPLYIQMGDESLRDGVECTPQDIFAYYDRTRKLCSTAAVTIGDYMDFFGAALKSCGEVVHFTISSEMSSCYQNAVDAAEGFGGRVRVVDSRNLSTGIGLLVLMAAELARQGRTAVEIEAAVNEKKEKLNVSFVIDTLEYLHKGGRCSGVAALGANLLKLKPCIEVGGGVMSVGKKYRGSQDKCIEAYVKERIGDGSAAEKDRIFITDSGVSDEIVAKTEAYLREQGFKEILHTRAGSSISGHCGPGTLGVLFFNK
ncbi:MAG: DegV family protein [Oscillospiraceae bacterium]|nr:DegV family protein [Oscillospiraceae bacterium]